MRASTQCTDGSNIRNKRLKCPHGAETNKQKTTELLLEKEKQCIVGQNRDQSNPIKATHTTAITRNICRIF